jgi:hypothetical protein
MEQRKMFRKGFADMVIIVMVIAGALVAWLVGPKVIKSVTGHDQNAKKSTYQKQMERTYYVPDEKRPGKFVIAHTDKFSEQSLNTDTQQPPETLWSKFWHMGFMAIVIIVALSYLGLWPIITLWWNKIIKPKIDKTKNDLENLQANHEELSADAKRIVLSVDEGLAVFDSRIASAKGIAEAAAQSLSLSSGITDPIQRAAALEAAQHAQMVAQAVCSSVTNLKSDFLTAMSRKQDSTTKALVAELKND